ncbi:hypothetical protein F2Q69_00025226 [Brassica cretica]|uniref:Uncharacterized protein n=1 Tax=Brassica cretica TaxID=69181 RepID=A0A8S9QB12_BRACR|nr:hypothetical protein F2Q69_00025226 [Brassica cretica]
MKLSAAASPVKLSACVSLAKLPVYVSLAKLHLCVSEALRLCIYFLTIKPIPVSKFHGHHTVKEIERITMLSLLLKLSSWSSPDSKPSLSNETFVLEPPEERVYDPHGQGVMLESEEEIVGEKGDKSWLRVYYCVIYLRPVDYHRICSLADWDALVRRHFAGRLFPVNEHAMRTIKNLYVENERVVLEEIWKHGFMALAAVGATNMGSIELSIEPELRTHEPKKKLFPAASLIVWKKALVPNLGSNTV